MTERDPVLEPFDALIGAWATEAIHPMFDGVVPRPRDAFAQRFRATPAADALEGLWQLARTPGDWRDDLKVSYRRA
jgi:hypothetical protein